MTKPTKIVYTVTQLSGGKNIWNRIGVAFENSDGSINVLLNALPVNGKLNIRNENKNPPPSYEHDEQRYMYDEQFEDDDGWDAPH